MNYHQRYDQLKQIYHPEASWIPVPGEDMAIHNLSFHSATTHFLPSGEETGSSVNEPYHLNGDNQIDENQNFVYPVVTGNQALKSDTAIVLLHGLNERDWNKYLPWAAALYERTGQPVVLFPISFHVNRTPPQWKDPRVMNRLAKERKRRYSGLSHSTYLNAAISERLQTLPKRFYTSGLETYYDLVELIRQIRCGQHPLLAQKKQVHFFGYSIGALLTQIMMMCNPGQLLSSSKALLFCGGATVDRMQGASRFILDNMAFETLRNYFLRLDEHLNNDPGLKQIIHKLNPGIYFRSMVNALYAADLRKQRFTDLADKLRIIALKKDQVIPARAIRQTFGQMNRQLLGLIQTMDFPFDYTHENVFPPQGPAEKNQVNRAFDRVFDQAGLYLQS